jgi:hypothetical protein
MLVEEILAGLAAKLLGVITEPYLSSQDEYAVKMASCYVRFT